MEMPGFLYSKGRLHLVWRDIVGNPAYMQIFHCSSSDGGRNWSPAHQVFNNSTSYVGFPTLAANGDSLFLACALEREYLFFRSFNAGVGWQDSSDIDQGPFVIVQYPKLLYANSVLQFIYSLIDADSSFGFEIYYKRSTDLGLDWSSRQIISPAEPAPDYKDSQIPSAFVDSCGRTLVAWMDYKYGSMCGVSGDIFYRVSLDNGETWQPWGSLTDTQSGVDSYCLILGDKFFVAWDDYSLNGCWHAKEAISVSGDSGQSWERPQFISGQNQADEAYPALAYTVQQDDTLLHFVFARFEPGSDLYYMRSQPFYSNHKPLPGPHPVILSIKAYPNVFNSSTLISFNNSEGGEVELEIYNLLGQKIWTKKLNGKEGSILLDAKDNEGNGISSGMYIIRATSKETEVTERLLYLK